ncbi:MAG: TRAP transporter large permease [Alphaproteobacteria bacterium]|nr:MAG: TRAP transporter large permease [Alphaproteobacteria bacterium]
MSALAALLPLALIASGMPVFLALLAAAVAVTLWVAPMPPMVLHQVVFGGLDTYALLAVPFFILAGELMGRSGIAARLIAWALALAGRIPGSLGVATVGASAVMGVISGSSAAAVGVLGRALYPRLVAEGWTPARAGGLISAAGAIDIVLPPSIAMILYGLAAEQSVTQLFLAGIIPGLVIAAAMVGRVLVSARRMPAGAGLGLAEKLRATRAAAAGLIMPVAILGGIWSGVFSPTEAGGFACLYAIIVARFLYRSMSWGEIVMAAGEAAILSAKILIIVAAAGLMTYILTTHGVPQALSGWIAAQALPGWAFLLAVNLVLLAVGCVLDPTSAILVLAPLLAPAAVAAGVDPVHFGVVMTVNLAIGMFTPPFGLNLFVASAVTGLAAPVLWRGVLPFVLVQCAALAVITYVPALSLALIR